MVLQSFVWVSIRFLFFPMAGFLRIIPNSWFEQGMRILSKPPLPFRERIRGEGNRRTDWPHAPGRMCRGFLASTPQIVH